MDTYLNIQVLPDPEFKEEVLMAALVAKLHRALGVRGKGDIGISFPNFALKTGDVLRLHGTTLALKELEETDWRKGLRDYCACTELSNVPALAQWRVVSRVQPKSSPDRLMRRSVRKGWLTQEEADIRLADMKEQKSDLPYLNLKSLSTQQHFRLFILHGDIVEAPVAGLFSSYGLSQTATIPWF